MQELPLELLTDSFAEKPKEKKPESKDKKPAAQKPAVQRVSLLDAKVLQNNGIVLKRFRYLSFCVALCIMLSTSHADSRVFRCVWILIFDFMFFRGCSSCLLFLVVPSVVVSYPVPFLCFQRFCCGSWLSTEDHRGMTSRLKLRGSTRVCAFTMNEGHSQSPLFALNTYVYMYI